MSRPPTLSLLPLLAVSPDVPEGARTLLQSAQAEALPEDRAAAVHGAARILLRDTDLECVEVTALLDLPDTLCHAAC